MAQIYCLVDLVRSDESGKILWHIYAKNVYKVAHLYILLTGQIHTMYMPVISFFLVLITSLHRSNKCFKRRIFKHEKI